jgi:hypothetical protein
MPDAGRASFASRAADRGNDQLDLFLPEQKKPAMPIQHITELFAFDGRAFVTEDYRYLLGREPDENGLRYYLGRLAIGYSKGAVLAQLARSPECRPHDEIKGLDKLIPESVLLAPQTEHNPLILFYNSASSLFTQLTMPRYEVKQSAKLNLTSYSGLALIGQCCQAAQVEEVIDPKLPVSQRMKTSYLALLRADSGFDSARLLFAKAAERDR